MLAKKIFTATNKLSNLRSFLTGNTPLVLLYHRVENLATDPQMLSVSPENFEKQVQLFQKEYDLLTSAEFVDCLHHNKLPRKALLLTFDDGYADNHYQARPILESLSAEAIFFITTGLIGTASELWWDELERILLLPGSLPPNLQLNDGQREYHFNTGDRSERQHAYEQLHPVIKYLPPQKRERLLGELRHWAGIDATGRKSHRMLSWDELKTFAQSKSVVIGAHTIHHAPLSILDAQAQRQEIEGSRQVLERVIEKHIRFFSYPFGIKRDYNDETIAICRELGFEIVFANIPGYARRSVDRFQVPRVLIRNWTAEQTRFQLKKFHG